MTGRHHHNANAATWRQARKPRGRPGHLDRLEGMVVASDPTGARFRLRVENSSRTPIHQGDEVDLDAAGAIVNLRSAGDPAASELVVGDVVHVDLEPVTARTDGHGSEGSPQVAGFGALPVHRVVRVGGAGPARTPADR